MPSLYVAMCPRLRAREITSTRRSSAAKRFATWADSSDDATSITRTTSPWQPAIDMIGYIIGHQSVKMNGQDRLPGRGPLSMLWDHYRQTPAWRRCRKWLG